MVVFFRTCFSPGPWIYLTGDVNRLAAALAAHELPDWFTPGLSTFTGLPPALVAVYKLTAESPLTSGPLAGMLVAADAAAACGFLARWEPFGGRVLGGCVQGEVVETAVPWALEGDASLCLLRKATLLSYTHMSVAFDQIQPQTDRQTDTDTHTQRHTLTQTNIQTGACTFAYLAFLGLQLKCNSTLYNLVRQILSIYCG